MNDNGAAGALVIGESIAGELLIGRFWTVLLLFASSFSDIAFSITPIQVMMIMRWWLCAEGLHLGGTLQRWVNKQTAKSGEYWQHTPTEERTGDNEWLNENKSSEPTQTRNESGHRSGTTLLAPHKVHFQSETRKDFVNYARNQREQIRALPSQDMISKKHRINI